MATLIDNPSFTANEVYELQQTDAVEGAGSGASFGGLGNDNQPHQQLANRTAWAMLLIAQLTAWVAMLLTWMGTFQCSLGVNGYIKIGMADIGLGSVVFVAQWGRYTPVLTADGVYNIAWPIAFPHLCLWGIASCSHSSGNPQGGNVSMQIVGLFSDHGTFESNWTGTGGVVEDGFYWFSIGY